MVSVTNDAGFVGTQIIKFDKIITNIGGGYIDDVNNADYGKFIAPKNGTYQFNSNLFNRDKLIGAELLKNGMLIIGTSNGGGGLASISAILDLNQGDQVYMQKPYWMPNESVLEKFFTSLSEVCTDQKSKTKTFV